MPEPDWKAMYLHMVHESEKALNILIAAQQACEEMYLSVADAEDDDEGNEENA